MVYQLGQPCQLLDGQATWRSWCGVLPPAIAPDFAATFHPLADRPFADTKGFGHPTLGPTLLFEAPGLKAPRFFPVLRSRGHA